MYKKVFRFILIFKKLEIGRGRVETGRRSSHSPLALIRAKLRPQSGGPDVDGVGIVDVGVGVECRTSLRFRHTSKTYEFYSVSNPFNWNCNLLLQALKNLSTFRRGGKSFVGE